MTNVSKDVDELTDKQSSLLTHSVALKLLKSADKEAVLAVLSGDLTKHALYKARIVRIFTSSTFTGTQCLAILVCLFVDVRKSCL